jgi:hypothetical protein
MKALSLVAVGAVLASYVACSSNTPRAQVLDTKKTSSASSAAGKCELEDFLEGQTDSNVFRLSADEINDINADDIGIELARSLVQHIARSKGCAARDADKFTVDSTLSECGPIVPKAEIESAACYVKTTVGDFFVIMDALGGANIVFNRLD